MRAGAAALAAVVLLAGCGEEGGDRQLAGPNFKKLDADQVMVEVEHYMTRDGVRRAHLVADTVYLMEEGSSAHLRHYTVDFFDAQGSRTSVLTAEDGVYDMQSGDMRASGDVVVVDPDESQQLRTERLRYDAETGKLRSDVAFTLVRGRDTLRGTGFVTDPGLDSLTTRQPAVVSPPGEQAGPRADTLASPERRRAPTSPDTSGAARGPGQGGG